MLWTVTQPRGKLRPRSIEKQKVLGLSVFLFGQTSSLVLSDSSKTWVMRVLCYSRRRVHAAAACSSIPPSLPVVLSVRTRRTRNESRNDFDYRAGRVLAWRRRLVLARSRLTRSVPDEN
jgi:hypothetical protein